MQFVAAFIKYNFMYSVFSHFKLAAEQDWGWGILEECVVWNLHNTTRHHLLLVVYECQDETLMCAHTASATL